jgi:hypothetical protein
MKLDIDLDKVRQLRQALREVAPQVITGRADNDTLSAALGFCAEVVMIRTVQEIQRREQRILTTEEGFEIMREATMIISDAMIRAVQKYVPDADAASAFVEGGK